MEFQLSLRERKLVVLGIPFDVETEELRHYMRAYGELDDCIIMKDRLSRQSRGFGYVTFSTAEDAKKVASSHHVLNGRTLDVKFATPKDEMVPSASRKVSRIFVARIPPHVTEGTFRSYFEKYGEIIDAYMPKDSGSRSHRGIGFVTFNNAESVDRIMNETHEIGGTLVAVDRATPKEETLKSWGARPQYEQFGNHLPEQWAKALPEQWSKALPDQWAKMSPEQFGFYMAAAAAAMAQMGALGGTGGSMEGFDLSSYGFPGFMGPGVGADNALEGEAGKSASAQVSDLPGDDAGVSKALPLSATDSASQSIAPQNGAAAAPGYHPEGATQSNTVSAYGNAALLNSMYSMFNGYGVTSSTTGMPSAVYANNAQGAGSGVMNSGAAFGQSADYSTASAMPGYYSSAAGDATAQPSGYDNHSGAGGSVSAGYTSNAYTYGGTGASGQGYNNLVSYAVPNAPNLEYSSAAYAPIPGTGYAPNTLYDQAGASYGSHGPQNSTLGNKVFIGKLPHEATAEHLRNYFSSYGRIADVYVPKDSKKTGHRGFGFVTFFDDGVAEQVALQPHQILGQPIAVDRPTPQDSGASFAYSGNPTSQWGSGAGTAWANTVDPQQSYEYAAGRLGYYSGGPPNSYDGGAGADRVQHPSDVRYRPY